MRQPNDELVFYCFGCHTLNIVLECSDQYGFVPEEHEIIKVPKNAPKINENGRQDLTFDGDYRLFELDVPYGSW
ncbi:hypothetical protein V1511DRAFT_507856 [Dipodascopsis uninucleata]